MALGNLKFTMIYSQVSLLDDNPVKLLKTSFTGMLTCPSEMFNRKTKNNTTSNELNKILF